MSDTAPRPSTVYGPVHSWRFGNSLGIDLLVETSICSFNCIYCQLGEIQRITRERREYVPTAWVVEDLAKVDWSRVDVVTVSGNGEPTLATNLGEVIRHVRSLYNKPVMVLTNATMLTDPAVRADLRGATTVACKLDAADEATLRRMNREAAGVTHEAIVEGIRLLRAEGFPGTLAVQCMFMPVNVGGARRLAELVATLRPDEIHLNTPRRPYPRAWYRDSRGNHEAPAPVPEVALKTISLEEARAVEAVFREVVPGARILSVYREAPEA